MEWQARAVQNLCMTDETVNFLAVPTYLRAWRKYRGLTQDDLGHLVGVSGSSISQLETGKQGFTDKTLAELAKALDCSPLALLAHDPGRPDSFWPLFEAAEQLKGSQRSRAIRMMRVAVDQDDAA